MNSETAKPFAMAGIAFLLDKYYVGEIDTMKSAYFAGAVGVGSYASQWVGPNY
jgi:hypothetical protein